MDSFIYLLVFGPMAAAILSFLMGRKTKTGRDMLVWAVVGIELLVSLLLFFRSAGAEDILVTVPGICDLV